MRETLWPTPGRFRSIAYDYGRKTGRLDLTCHTTLPRESCVWVFCGIDPAVQTIEVLREGAPIEKHNRDQYGAWRSRCPVSA